MRAPLLPMLTLAVFSPSPCLPANILISGNAMNQSDATLTGNLSELTGANTLTFVSPINFASTALAGAMTSSGSTDSASISTSPACSEPLTAYPHAAGLVAAFVFGDTVHITGPSDFMDAGLTDAALSNWNGSYYGYFTTTTPNRGSPST